MRHDCRWPAFKYWRWCQRFSCSEEGLLYISKFSLSCSLSDSRLILALQWIFPDPMSQRRQQTWFFSVTSYALIPRPLKSNMILIIDDNFASTVSKLTEDHLFPVRGLTWQYQRVCKKGVKYLSTWNAPFSEFFYHLVGWIQRYVISERWWTARQVYHLAQYTWSRASTSM